MMDRVWMITGAGRGFGRAFTEQAAAKGDKVIAAVRKLNRDERLMQNENVFPVIMDVTDPSAVHAAVEAGIEKYGKIDVLVNNAGYGLHGAFEEMSDAELRALMEADFFGVVNVTKAVLPVMRKQNRGMVLNVASQAGAMGFLGNTAYCAAKFAVVGLSQSLRMELNDFGVQVAAVLPGSFRTDFRDSSSMRIAQNQMAEYDGTQLRATRDYMTEHNHMQEGDPAKAAAFLYGIVDSGKLPRRILIGKKCCADVKNDLLEQIDEIDSYIEASSKTDYE